MNPDVTLRSAGLLGIRRVARLPAKTLPRFRNEARRRSAVAVNYPAGQNVAAANRVAPRRYVIISADRVRLLCASARPANRVDGDPSASSAIVRRHLSLTDGPMPAHVFRQRRQLTTLRTRA